MLVVVAMPQEMRLLTDPDLDGEDFIVTGAGALNVIDALKDIDRNEQIYNIGYVGSKGIPVGTKVRIGAVRAYHPNIVLNEPSYILDGDITCYTAGDFVLGTDIDEQCVFDMELAYILAMGFRNVVSEKVVSDCLDMKQFNEMVRD